VPAMCDPELIYQLYYLSCEFLGFLHKKSHLQTEIALPPSFRFGRFYFFFLSIALSRTSSKILNSRGEIIIETWRLLLLKKKKKKAKTMTPLGLQMDGDGGQLTQDKS
jgi:hypothetical protein